MAISERATITTAMAIAASFLTIVILAPTALAAAAFPDGDFEAGVPGTNTADWTFEQYNDQGVDSVGANITFGDYLHSAKVSGDSSFAGQHSVLVSTSFVYGPGDPHPEATSSTITTIFRPNSPIDLSSIGSISFAYTSEESGSRPTGWNSRTYMVLRDDGGQEMTRSFDLLTCVPQVGADGNNWSLCVWTAQDQWKKPNIVFGIAQEITDYVDQNGSSEEMNMYIDDIRFIESGGTGPGPGPGTGNNTTANGTGGGGLARVPNDSAFKGLMSPFCLWPMVIFAAIGIAAPVTFFFITRDHPLP